MTAVMIVFLIVGVVLVVRLSRRVTVLEKDLKDAEDRLSDVAFRVADFEVARRPDLSGAGVKEPGGKARASTAPGDPSRSFDAAGTADVLAPRGEGPAAPREAPSRQERAEPGRPEEVTRTDSGTASIFDVPPALGRRVEKQIAENWTGIAGTAILVLGIGFLGVYTALRLSALFRFLMIVACALALGGGYVVLSRRPKWLRLALWLRSASGAVFLFACLGAGSIDGLRWLGNPVQARAVLGAGILANLLLAVAGGRQIFASLHVLLSLLALAVSPQNMTTFLVAAVVAAFGAALTFREKWDLHLLATLTAFFAYHLFWYIRIGGKAALSGGENVVATATLAAVFAIAAFVHYRKVYGQRRFETIPFLVHLLNWTSFGAGILMHSRGIKWDTFPLLAGAAAAFALAQYARRLGIRWLHCLDTLIAEIIAVLALSSLTRWGVTADVIRAAVFLEILAFIRVAMLVEEGLLYRVGIAVSQPAAVIFLASTFHPGGAERPLRHCGLACLCGLGALALHRSIARSGGREFILRDSLFSGRRSEDAEFSITGVMTGAFLLAAGVYARDIPWLYAAVVAAGCGLLLLGPKIATKGLAVGSLAMAAGLHAVSWYELLTRPELGPSAVLARAVPLYALSAVSILRAYVPPLNAQFRRAGVWLAVAHSAILCYVLSEPVSPLVPGVCWLLLSVLVLEAGRLLGSREGAGPSLAGRPDRSLLHAGYALLGLFLFRHILVHLQSEAYLGFLKSRLAIEILALAVMLFWAFAKPPSSQAPWANWRLLHPLCLELLISFGVLTISVETAKYWHPLVWMALAAAAAVIGVKAGPSLSRLKAYSVLFYWASVFQATFLLGVYEKLGTHWYEKARIVGPAAFVAQLGFLVVFVKRVSLEDVRLPAALRWLGPACRRLNALRNALTFYPWLAGAALFLSWTFNKALLTLLWTLECFAVFVISLVLKERHFRYAALAGLAVCVARLMIYDLARTTTLTKALVFLGVGLLMLGMHALYNKYKERFFDESA